MVNHMSLKDSECRIADDSQGRLMEQISSAHKEDSTCRSIQHFEVNMSTSTASFMPEGGEETSE